MPRTMPPVQSVGDVLEAAAHLLSKPGAWIQGKFFDVHDGQECFCALGAIARAGGFSAALVIWRGGTGLASTAYRYLANAVGQTWAEEWNDEPERTQAEVVAKLREAAAKARAESIA